MNDIQILYLIWRYFLLEMKTYKNLLFKTLVRIPAFDLDLYYDNILSYLDL